MSLPPFFDKAPSIINKPDGTVLFECMCNANPEPTVKWFFKVTHNTFRSLSIHNFQSTNGTWEWK